MKFPTTPVDGDAVSDTFGNIYQYDSKTKTWLSKGRIVEPLVVSIENDGLVTTNIYNSLRLLSTPQNFKISPHTVSYWYYLYSKYNLFDIKYENDNKLRLEINKSKLVSVFMRNTCIGEIGPKGITGKPGKNGKSKKEEFLKFNSTPIQFEYTTTGIFSLRLYSKTYKIGSEVRISEDGLILSVDEYFISLTDLKATVLDGILTVDFTVRSGTPYYYKIGLIGAKGEKGIPGETFINVVEFGLEDDLMMSSKPITSVRSTDNQIKYARASINTSCTMYLSQNFFDNTPLSNGIRSMIIDNDSSLTNAETVFNKLKLVNVNETTETCKPIGNYRQQHEEIKLRELTLPSWTPTVTCYDTTRWNNSKFDWWTSLDDNLDTWSDCDGEAKPTSYPWTIIISDAPESRCCQEDFFWCPNVQDQSCPTQVVGDPTFSLVNEGGCGCDEYRVLGNYFQVLNKDPQSNVINGNVHTYHYNIEHAGYLEIVLKYDMKCGNNNCQILWSFESDDKNLISPRTNKNRLENENSIIELFFKKPGLCDFTVLVNTDYKTCCTAYTLEANESTK